MAGCVCLRFIRHRLRCPNIWRIKNMVCRPHVGVVVVIVSCDKFVTNSRRSDMGTTRTRTNDRRRHLSTSRLLRSRCGAAAGDIRMRAIFHDVRTAHRSECEKIVVCYTKNVCISLFSQNRCTRICLCCRGGAGVGFALVVLTLWWGEKAVPQQIR